MEKLTENKRKWIINKFRQGRSATSIAKIQGVTRQFVYKLAIKYKKEGEFAYKAKNAGRPKMKINSLFIKKVIEIRKRDDYGSQKIHFVLNRDGFKVSQHIIQSILNEQGLTDPCEKRRGQRKYVRYVWPICNYMWHCDWTEYKSKLYCAFIDDTSRKIMGAAVFNTATTDNALFVLYQSILSNQVCPAIILSDKGSQFYANKYDKKGIKGISEFEQELKEIGIDHWTSRRNHPQTNGKMEKWFDTMKKRFKKHPEESLQEFVKWYNEERIHYSLYYKTPEQEYQEKM